MRFAIVGAGRVGRRTARVLQEEGHDVTVLELEASIVERLREEGYDVIHGSGTKEDDLLALDLEATDAVGALTSDLTTNFVTSMVAKSFDCRTVMRVDRDYREQLVRKYATEVDEVIYPERLGAIAAKNALVGGDVRAIADIASDVQLVQLTVTEASPMRGYTLSELELPADARLLGFAKRGEPVGLPDEDVSLETGDRLVVIAGFDVLADVRQIIVGDVESATRSTSSVEGNC
jgi:trk system potassium uptake protein TrkA